MARNFELRAFVEETGGGRSPFLLRISRPRKGRSKDDYYCRIHLPVKLQIDKEIYGIDPEQAMTLSKNFARILLADQKITDAEGNPVSF